MTSPRSVDVDGSGGEAVRPERGRELHQEPREALDEMSEELTSTDAKSEMGRRLCRVMFVKKPRAGDRGRSQKILECRKCVVA